MQIAFDVDTALSEVPVNIMPLIDDTDFKTREESVVWNQSGLDLVWNFVTTAGAFTQTAVTPTNTGGDYDWVNQGNGMYTIEIPASGGASINNDTEGFGWFVGFATGILPWRGPICVFRSSIINNALIDDTSLLTSKDVGLNYESTIGTVTSQTVFICDSAINTNDLLNGLMCTIEDVSTGDSHTTWVTDTAASGNTITIQTAAPFTVVANDIIRVFGIQHPTYALSAYTAPTTADTDAIQAGVNVTQVAGITVTGTGADGDEWGP